MSDYKVHKVWIQEVEFELLILEIPVEEIDDKLAYFARDKGLITKSFYEDFVIITCIANINQLMSHIKQNVDKNVDMVGVRKLVTDEIYKINSSLIPENLVINRNMVVKIKGKDSEDERPLTSNKSWEIDEYANYSTVTEDGEAKEEETKEKEPAYEITKRWWKRLNKYIDIKKYDEDDFETILGKTFFYNRSTFHTYVVTLCIVESEDLFNTLDEAGILSRVSPPTIMSELYELCKEVNPFLTFEGARNVINRGIAEDGVEDCDGKCNKASASKKDSSKKKKKRLFRDVLKEELLNLSNEMSSVVIGQQEAINSLTDSIKRASVGLRDPERPIGSFIFAGTSGCGKTLTSKVLAEKLTKDKCNLTIIDCSEYMADHEYSKLIGAPNGYVGFEQGGILTNAVMENPFNVVVFDEIEKANSKVYDLMLQILDEGRLTDNKGNKVSFKDTVIIMTSNIGTTEVKGIEKTIGFGDVNKITETKKAAAINTAITSKFRPEFINRIDSIIYFNTLTKKDYLKIINIELNKLNANLRANDTEYSGIKLVFDTKLKSYILKNGINESLGARPLKRCIEKEISTPLANKLLTEDLGPYATIKVTLVNGKVSFVLDKTEEDNEFIVMSGVC